MKRVTRFRYSENIAELIDGWTIDKLINYLEDLQKKLPKGARLFTESFHDSAEVVIQFHWSELETDEEYKIRLAQAEHEYKIEYQKYLALKKKYGE